MVIALAGLSDLSEAFNHEQTLSEQGERTTLSKIAFRIANDRFVGGRRSSALQPYEASLS